MLRMTMIAAGFLFACAAGVLATEEMPTTKPGAAAAEISETVKKMAADLGADEFAVRDAAQRKLQELGIDALPAIEAAIKQTEGEERKARLRAAADAILFHAAVNPPAFGLELDRVQPKEIAAAVSKAVGREIKWKPVQLNETYEPISLKISKRSFWEVIAALSSAAPMDFDWNEPTGAIQLYNGDSNFFKHASIQGAFVFSPWRLVHDSSVMPGTGESSRTFNVSIVTAADPRLSILSWRTPQLRVCRDDANNNLLPTNEDRNDYVEFDELAIQSLVHMKYPEKPGKKITAMKGECAFVVMTRSQTIEIDDIEKFEDKKIGEGDFSVTFNSVKCPIGSLSFGYSAVAPRDAVVPGGSERSIAAYIDLSDSAGKWQIKLPLRSERSSYSMMTDDAVKPIKAKVTLPTQYKAVTVPFEFKDLPMP